MSTAEDIQNTKGNILSIFETRKVKIYALSLSYAGKALNRFRQAQDGGQYWENRTNQAKDRMFSNAFIMDDVIGWFLSHGVLYGVYLELANDRQNEAISPIIRELAPKFFEDVGKL